MPAGQPPSLKKYEHQSAGDAYFRERKYAEALAEFELAMKLSEQDRKFESAILIKLVQAYYAQGKYEQGINELKKYPSDSASALFMGIGLMARGDLDGALREYMQAAETCGNDKKMQSKAGFHIMELVESANLSGNPRAAEMAEFALKAELKGNAKVLNVLNNELEIARGAVKLDSKLRKLVVNLTNQCNLNCKMCFSSKIPVSEISAKVAGEIKSVFPYLSQVNWLGGEVFLYKGFSALFDLAIASGVKQEIVTNGLLIDENTAAKLIDNNVKLVLSIDGTTKEVYEDIRKGGSFSELLSKLDMLNRVRARSNPEYAMDLNVVVTKSNYHQLERFPEFAAKYGFKNIYFMMMVGNAGDQDIFNFNRDAKILSIVRSALAVVRSGCAEYGINFDTNITEDVLTGGSAPKRQAPACGEKPAGEDRGRKEKCFAPWKELNVDTSGLVTPIVNCFCKNIVGDLNTETMEELWNGKKMTAYRKKILAGGMDQICTMKKARQ